MFPTVRSAAIVVVVVAAAQPAAASTTLRFVRDGAEVRRADVEELRGAAAVQRVAVDDPYYGVRKTFLALPLAEVLRFGFGEEIADLRREDFLLQALDGYAKPASGRTLAEDGGYLAFGDAELSKDGRLGWQPIDRRQVDPAPYYLVWTKEHQREDTHPWPYQLATIEIVDFEKRYPRTVPRTAPRDAAAWRGFATFRGRCVSCHAMNGDGGKIGPDLNAPRSIVEYRPVDQIKQFIRNPQSFRYTTMPAHEDLGAKELDDLVAYFEVMKTLKPEAVGATDPRSAASSAHRKDEARER